MNTLKILHLNNIAQIGQILSNQQNYSGLDSEFTDLIKPFAKSKLKYLAFPIRILHALYLRLKIRLKNISIIHVHYSTSALLFLFTKAKLVVHVHGSDVRDQHKSKLFSIINSLVFKFADLILYSTPDLKPHIDRFNVISHFIPNPLDIENFYETSEPKDKSVFIHASISHIKGADIFLPALNKANDKYRDLMVSYLGFGDMINEVKNSQFKRLTKVNRIELKNIISEHGLIIGQFRVGAIGMSELEVLACKRPVVCHFEYNDAYPESPPFLLAKTTDEIFKIIEDYYFNPEKFSHNKDKYRNWVKNYHSTEKIERLVYEKYLLI